MKKATSTAGVKKSEPIKFHTTILQTGKNTCGIQVPAEIIERLGPKKQPLVRMVVVAS